uniref:Secreted protein n=1 Tax=Anguilla anguilla TaxID=7936 RepID=A0A0E9VJB0_ANGAN
MPSAAFLVKWKAVWTFARVMFYCDVGAASSIRPPQATGPPLSKPVMNSRTAVTGSIIFRGGLFCGMFCHKAC